MADNKPATTNQNGVAPAKPSSVKEFMAMPSTVKRVEELLGDRASQFMTSVSSMVGADDKLAKCEPVSLFMAALTAAALDLPINKNLGFAHIIPYANNNQKVTEAQFQMGWKGYVQLAQRTGQYKSIAATPVYEGQLVREDPLRGNTYDWDGRVNDTVIGYVAVFVLTTGFDKELYMSVKELIAHADKYSKAYNRGQGFGPWKDNFDAMALKTVIKLLISKWGPMSVSSPLHQALTADSAVMDKDGKPSYIDGDVTIGDVDATDEEKSAILEANGVDVADGAPTELIEGDPRSASSKSTKAPKDIA